ncbi:hypothetical protein ACLI4Y_09870 [Natrialbaceae archaeon A-CW3]
MTRISEERLTDEMVVRNLTYQFDRALQLLECLAAEGQEGDPEVCVIGSYSKRKLEAAAEQALTGWSLPKDTTCSQCERVLAAYRPVTIRARRPLELLTWYLDQCVCDECDVPLDPRPDGLDVIASAWIAPWDDPEGRRPLLLSDVTIEESSGTNYETGSNVEENDGTQ